MRAQRREPFNPLVNFFKLILEYAGQRFRTHFGPGNPGQQGFDFLQAEPERFRLADQRNDLCGFLGEDTIAIGGPNRSDEPPPLIIPQRVAADTCRLGELAD